MAQCPHLPRPVSPRAGVSCHPGPVAASWRRMPSSRLTNWKLFPRHQVPTDASLCPAIPPGSTQLWLSSPLGPLPSAAAPQPPPDTDTLKGHFSVVLFNIPQCLMPSQDSVEAVPLARGDPVSPVFQVRDHGDVSLGRLVKGCLLASPLYSDHLSFANNE